MEIENPAYPGDTPLTGWEAISHCAGWSLRKAKGCREQMLADKVIYYERKAKQRVVRAWAVDIKRFVKNASQRVQ
jgi:hypothetical protein